MGQFTPQISRKVPRDNICFLKTVAFQRLRGAGNLKRGFCSVRPRTGDLDQAAGPNCLRSIVRPPADSGDGARRIMRCRLMPSPLERAPSVSRRGDPRHCRGACTSRREWRGWMSPICGCCGGTAQRARPGFRARGPQARERRGAAKPTSEVIRREVTVFSNVKHGPGTVVTGWTYPDGGGSVPVRQYCYYSASNVDHSSTRVDIAFNGDRASHVSA